MKETNLWHLRNPLASAPTGWGWTSGSQEQVASPNRDSDAREETTAQVDQQPLVDFTIQLCNALRQILSGKEFLIFLEIQWKSIYLFTEVEFSLVVEER